MKNPRQTYTPSKHLSQEQLLRYQSAEMSGAEMQQVERHLLSCELCSDALEGISMLQSQQAKSSLEDVKLRLAQRLNEEKAKPAAPAYWNWVAAASVLLIALAATFFLYNELQSTDQPMAGQENADIEIDSPISTITQPQQQAPEGEPVLPLAGNEVSEQEPAASEAFKIDENEPLPAPQQEIAQHDELPPAIPEIPYPAEVMEIAEEQAPIAAGYKEKEIASTPRAKKPLPALADQVDAPQPLTESKPIDISASSPARAPEKTTAAAGTKQLKGIVKDANSGEPLPGVNVRIKGSDRGTVTDINGEYTLTLPASDATLSFNFVGYREKLVAVNDKTTQLTANLEEDVQALSEVVVTGRGMRSMRQPVVKDKPTPTPADGMRRFNRYTDKNLRYPAEAAQAGIQGEVVVEFFVEADGSLSQLEIVKSADATLNEEALRLVKEGPAWEPATSNGSPIRQKASVSISFKLPRR